MKLVLIDWVDSHGTMEGWQHLDGKDTPKPISCRSVGWLQFDGEDCKKIIPHLAGDDFNLQGRGDLTIPTKSILNIRIIE